ncbi:MAG: DUF4938 domain-containing protein [Oscillochloris sp.]|nr:DUF4938 domain-containing protein [Oscillochloris sp.]
MTTPIDIIRLHAYAGPNIFGPRPGVLLRAWCATDRARRLRVAIRDGAQSVGIVIAYLESEARPLAEGFLLEARFITEEPAIGVALCRYIIDGMRAEAVGDEEWDGDGLLYDLQSRRRSEALPVVALQLMAEARRRGLPALTLPDGQIQLGYGARSWQARPHPGDQLTPPWAEIGSIPITLVTGCALRATAVERYAAEIAAFGFAVRVEDGLGFDAVRDLLADPATEAAVIGLDTNDLLHRGLPLDRCNQAVISDMAGSRPPSADDDAEWLRALGLPMLLSPDPVRLNFSDIRLHALIPYAPNGVLSADLI